MYFLVELSFSYFTYASKTNMIDCVKICNEGYLLSINNNIVLNFFFVR